MTLYSHLFFDHDGVLVDTEPLYFQATQETLRTLGVELLLEDYLKLQAIGGNAWQAALEQGYSDLEVQTKREERNQRYQQLLSAEPIEIEGVLDVLSELA